MNQPTREIHFNEGKVNDPVISHLTTPERYKYATIFVDHYSDLDYVHLHCTNTGEAIQEAKTAFEQFAQNFGVKIKHSRADNGRFSKQLFLQSVHNAGQTVSFCGVNAHHQSG